MEEKNDKRLIIRNIDIRSKAFSNMELRVFLLYVLPLITPLIILLITLLYSGKILSIYSFSIVFIIAGVITLFSEFDNFRKETILQLLYEFVVNSKVEHIENFKRE